VIYARVSSKEQDREGFSIPAQLRLLQEYGRDHGFRLTDEFVDVETAKRSGRTGFTAMVARLRRTRATAPVLLVEKTDRLYRNLKDWVTLDELDVEIHFVREGVVLSRESRSSEKFMHGIKVLMAKNYIDNLSEEVRKGMNEKAAEGIWPTKAPIGYLNVLAPDGKRVIDLDPSTAPIVRQVFEWYGTGRYSLSIITDMAWEAGLRFRRTGAKVPRSGIHKMLRHPLYQGDVVWDGQTYRGIHEPLVSRRLWDEVQQILSGRPGKHRRTRRQFAFAGLITCGRCGCSVTAEMKKGRYVYYHCTGARGNCRERYVREEELEERFTEILGGLKLPPDILDWLTGALRHSDGEQRRARAEAVARLQAEALNLQRRLDAMYVDKLDGRLDAVTYERLAGAWRADQHRLLCAIEDQRPATEASPEDGARLLELAGQCQELFARQPAAEKRKLLDFALSNCSWAGGTLTPVFRPPFDLLVETNKSALRPSQRAWGETQNAARFDLWLGVHQQNRWMLHLVLARLTDYVERESGNPSRYPEYVGGTGKHRYEVEHIWANKPEEHTDEFTDPSAFRERRNRLGGLLILPKSFNAAYGALPYDKKLKHYNTQRNLLAQSLHSDCYDRNPGFTQFVTRTGLPFRPYETFKRADLEARQQLYAALAERIWNPDLLLREVGG